MHSFVGLLRREWLENRAAFLGSIGSVLALLMLAFVMVTLIDPHIEADFDSTEINQLDERMTTEERRDAGIMEIAAAMLLDVAGSTDAELESKLSTLLRGIAVPFQFIYLIVAFFALLSCLYDERKDQSILFWKSMPVSDTATVVSKVAFVLWVAPIVAVLGIVIAQFLVVTIGSFVVEDGMGGRVWGQSQIWQRPFEYVTHYFVLGLWALPAAGWIVVVSSWANKLPILWVFGVPFVIALLEDIFFGSSVLLNQIGAHFALLDGMPHGTQVSILAQFSMLAEVRFWFGLVVGLLFIALTIQIRGKVS